MSEDAVRIVGPVICRVFDNEDPRDIGRVRFTMPGLEEPHSLWAVPGGWGVPFYDFRSDRDQLKRWADSKDKGEQGRQAWRDKNAASIDGLPGLKGARRS